MIKQTITYEDWNGVTRTEDFYFGLTEAELMKKEYGTEGRYTDLIEKVIKAKDQVQIMNLFEQLVLMAYGEKSDDGKYFTKNDAIRERFASCPAYSTLYMELAMDSDKASVFVNGILPKSISKYSGQYDPDTVVKMLESGKSINDISNMIANEQVKEQ